LSRAPILVFAWGNPSRGDDALGPELLEGLGERPGVERLTDFQLQPEHVTDVHGRRLVLFVDAAVAVSPPFQLRRLHPRRDASFTSHAMTPEALLSAYRDVYDSEPPPCYLLAIRGEDFELGQPLGEAAGRHLARALSLVDSLLRDPAEEAWDAFCAVFPVA
jgi:hydrogenase maturation protease